MSVASPVTNVFVACPDHSDLAHRLVARIAEVKASTALGDAAQFQSTAAATDYASPDGRLFDLVTAPADPRLFSSRRGLAEDANVLLIVAGTAEDARQSYWWTGFPQRARVVVSLQPSIAAPDVDGSPICCVELTGSLAPLLDTLEAAQHR